MAGGLRTFRRGVLDIFPRIARRLSPTIAALCFRLRRCASEGGQLGSGFRSPSCFGPAINTGRNNKTFRPPSFCPLPCGREVLREKTCVSYPY